MFLTAVVRFTAKTIQNYEADQNPMGVLMCSSIYVMYYVGLIMYGFGGAFTVPVNTENNMYETSGCRFNFLSEFRLLFNLVFVNFLSPALQFSSKVTLCRVYL